MNNNFNVGDRLRTLRTERGLSQEQLGLMADITPSYIGQIERNIKNPTVRTLEKICDIIDVTLRDFFVYDAQTTEHDSLTLQIISQLSNRSNYEKEYFLNYIKEHNKYLDNM